MKYILLYIISEMDKYMHVIQVKSFIHGDVRNI